MIVIPFKLLCFAKMTFNKHTIDRFKVVADKDMKKMSNIVENLIRRYVESRV